MTLQHGRRTRTGVPENAELLDDSIVSRYAKLRGINKHPEGTLNTGSLPMESNEDFYVLTKANQHRAVPKNVVRVKIDSSVQVISGSAFRDCNKLKDIEFSEGLVTIGEEAFVYLFSLESICLPSTIRIIGKHAFHRCSQLKNVTLNEGLKEIQDGAFFGTGVKLVCMPSTVRIIGSGAFGCCVRLKNVTLNEGLERLGANTFKSCPRLENVYAPLTFGSPSSSTIDEADSRKRKPKPKSTKSDKKNESAGHNGAETSSPNAAGTKQLRDYQDYLNRTCDMTKKLQASVAERGNEILTLRRELQRTISDHNGETQSLRNKLKRADERTKMMKDEHDEEIKSLRAELKQRDGKVKNMRERNCVETKFLRSELRLKRDRAKMAYKTLSTKEEEMKCLRQELKESKDSIKALCGVSKGFARLQASLDTMKQQLVVASVPKTGVVTANGKHTRSNKRPRLKFDLDGIHGVVL